MANWSEDSLRILLGLFYCRPLNECDDRHEINFLVSTQLGRSPQSIDRQWRNVQTLVRGRRGNLGNISQTLKRLVEDHRDDPVNVIEEGKKLAEELDQDFSGLFPEQMALDSSPFSDSCSPNPEPDLDPVLFQIVWHNPKLVLLRKSLSHEDWKWVGRQMSNDPGRLRNRARTIYAVMNRIELSNKKMESARESLVDILGTGPLPLDKLKEDADRACLTNGWVVYAYTRS